MDLGTEIMFPKIKKKCQVSMNRNAELSNAPVTDRKHMM